MDVEIEELLRFPNLWDEIVIDELSKKIAGEHKSREIIFLCGIGRLVKNAELSSFNLLIHSKSSAGKDFVSDAVLSIFPKQNIFKKSRISERVLNYWKPYLNRNMESWNGNILYLIDIGETILNSEALKVMCSEGSNITIMEKVGGKLEAVDVEIEGKPVIITTTATAIPTEEIMNRFIILRMDESEEQTKRIKKFISKIAETGIKPFYSERVLNAIAELKPYNVKIPFVEKIDKVFPYNKLRVRRLYTTFLDMIRAVCILHQYQRDKQDSGTLIAELKDYDIAKDCFMNLTLSMSDIPLDDRKKSIIEILRNSEEGMSASEIQPYVKPHLSLSAIKPHLETLMNLHLIESFIINVPLRPPITKYKLDKDLIEDNSFNLPNSADLG